MNGPDKAATKLPDINDVLDVLEHNRRFSGHLHGCAMALRERLDGSSPPTEAQPNPPQASIEQVGVVVALMREAAEIRDQLQLVRNLLDACTARLGLPPQPTGSVVTPIARRS